MRLPWEQQPAQEPQSDDEDDESDSSDDDPSSNPKELELHSSTIVAVIADLYKL